LRLEKRQRVQTNEAKSKRCRSGASHTFLNLIYSCNPSRTNLREDSHLLGCTPHLSPHALHVCAQSTQCAHPGLGLPDPDPKVFCCRRVGMEKVVHFWVCPTVAIVFAEHNVDKLGSMQGRGGGEVFTIGNTEEECPRRRRGLMFSRGSRECIFAARIPPSLGYPGPHQPRARVVGRRRQQARLTVTTTSSQTWARDR